MSQRESSRQRRTGEIPEWGREAVSSTEKLMETFYATSPGAGSGRERVAEEPVADRGADGMSPITLSLAEEPAGEGAARPAAASGGNGHDAERAGAPGASEEPNRLETETQTRLEADRGDRRTRTRVPAKRRASLASAERVYMAPPVMIAAMDPAFIELFPGRSLSLYKALYERTLGAEVPVESLNATKQELSAWSGISHRHTLIKHIQHLMAVRLVKRIEIAGDTRGPLYRVRKLEEVGVSPEAAQSFYRMVIRASPGQTTPYDGQVAAGAAV